MTGSRLLAASSTTCRARAKVTPVARSRTAPACASVAALKARSISRGSRISSVAPARLSQEVPPIHVAELAHPTQKRHGGRVARLGSDHVGCRRGEMEDPNSRDLGLGASGDRGRESRDCEATNERASIHNEPPSGRVVWDRRGGTASGTGPPRAGVRGSLTHRIAALLHAGHVAVPFFLRPRPLPRYTAPGSGGFTTVE